MDPLFWFYILCAIGAQFIDGCLGMAYGVSLNSLLLTIGVSAAMASASIHMAEMCTTAVSGISHFKIGNVHKPLFLRLIIPGIIGGVIGAYLISEVLDGKILSPFVSVYLLIMGIRILLSKHWILKKLNSNKTSALALAGGFFDAIGGGGWGPIVTTSLIARDLEPRMVIGSVNAAEFFVTVAESITFLIFLDIENYWIVGGLIIGGVIMAPFAAVLSKKVRADRLLKIVGILIISLQVRMLLKTYTTLWLSTFDWVMIILFIILLGLVFVHTKITEVKANINPDSTIPIEILSKSDSAS